MANGHVFTIHFPMFPDCACTEFLFAFTLPTIAKRHDVKLDACSVAIAMANLICRTATTFVLLPAHSPSFEV